MSTPYNTLTAHRLDPIHEDLLLRGVDLLLIDIVFRNLILLCILHVRLAHFYGNNEQRGSKPSGMFLPKSWRFLLLFFFRRIRVFHVLFAAELPFQLTLRIAWNWGWGCDLGVGWVSVHEGECGW